MPEIDPKIKEAALKPFKEKEELAELAIEEIREKLGEEEASKINDTLINLRGTLTEASQIHETVVQEALETKDRNQKLVEVNNDLYIKNADSIRKINGKEVEPEEVEDDNALDVFVDSVIS